MNQQHPTPFPSPSSTTYLLPLSTSVTILTSLATFFLLGALLLRRRSWNNAPPGPTVWPVIGCLPYLTNRLHEDFHRLAKTYGPLFSLRLGQSPAIVVSSPEMTREVLKHNDIAFSSRTITEAVRYLAYEGTTLVFVPYGPRWRLLRKIMTSEVFSSRALELFHPARRQQVQVLLRSLYSAWGSKTAVNIADLMFIASTNLITNLICSKTMYDSSEEGRELREMVWEALEVAGTPNIADLIPVFKVVDLQGLRRRLRKVAKKFDDFFERLIDCRLEERKNGVKSNENGRMDLLDVFLDYRSDKEDEIKEFSRVDIKGMLADMFIAGSDTSSSTVEWGMTEILRHPEVYKKVVVELDEVVGKNRLVEESDIPKLAYFQAVVKEVFRLHPAVPLLIPRRTNEATEVFGYHIPKYTTVFVNVWSIGRDPKVWPKPTEFRPERFIGRDMDVKGQDMELLPFGTGRRSCVGMPLGHRMVHYSLASLLHSFEWDILGNMLNDTTEKVGITLHKAESLVGMPMPRLGNLVYQC